jgi:hypothetical protein
MRFRFRCGLLMEAVAMLGFVVAGAFSDCAAADIGSFASSLNSSGRLYHDSGFSGPEVVYRSSGLATRQEAIAAWMRSRAGHRELIESGSITQIVCVGNVCVGRGFGVTQTARMSSSRRMRLFR